MSCTLNSARFTNLINTQISNHPLLGKLSSELRGVLAKRVFETNEKYLGQLIPEGKEVTAEEFYAALAKWRKDSTWSTADGEELEKNLKRLKSVKHIRTSDKALVGRTLSLLRKFSFIHKKNATINNEIGKAENKSKALLDHVGYMFMPFPDSDSTDMHRNPASLIARAAEMPHMGGAKDTLAAIARLWNRHLRDVWMEGRQSYSYDDFLLAAYLNDIRNLASGYFSSKSKSSKDASKLSKVLQGLAQHRESLVKKNLRKSEGELAELQKKLDALKPEEAKTEAEKKEILNQVAELENKMDTIRENAQDSSLHAALAKADKKIEKTSIELTDAITKAKEAHVTALGSAWLEAVDDLIKKIGFDTTVKHRFAEGIIGKWLEGDRNLTDQALAKSMIEQYAQIAALQKIMWKAFAAQKAKGEKLTIGNLAAWLEKRHFLAALSATFTKGEDINDSTELSHDNLKTILIELNKIALRSLFLEKRTLAQTLRIEDIRTGAIWDGVTPIEAEHIRTAGEALSLTLQDQKTGASKAKRDKVDRKAFLSSIHAAVERLQTLINSGHRFASLEEVRAALGKDFEDINPAFFAGVVKLDGKTAAGDYVMSGVVDYPSRIEDPTSEAYKQLVEVLTLAGLTEEEIHKEILTGSPDALTPVKRSAIISIDIETMPNSDRVTAVGVGHIDDGDFLGTPVELTQLRSRFGGRIKIGPDGKRADFTAEDVLFILEKLSSLQQQGYTITSHNGVGFDFLKFSTLIRLSTLADDAKANGLLLLNRVVLMSVDTMGSVEASVGGKVSLDSLHQALFQKPAKQHSRVTIGGKEHTVEGHNFSELLDKAIELGDIEARNTILSYLEEDLEASIRVTHGLLSRVEPLSLTIAEGGGTKLVTLGPNRVSKVFAAASGPGGASLRSSLSMLQVSPNLDFGAKLNIAASIDTVQDMTFDVERLQNHFKAIFANVMESSSGFGSVAVNSTILSAFKSRLDPAHQKEAATVLKTIEAYAKASEAMLADRHTRPGESSPSLVLYYDDGKPVFVDESVGEDRQAASYESMSIEAFISYFKETSGRHDPISRLERLAVDRFGFRNKDLKETAEDYVKAFILQSVLPKLTKQKLGIVAFGNGKVDFAPAFNFGYGLAQILDGRSSGVSLNSAKAEDTSISTMDELVEKVDNSREVQKEKPTDNDLKSFRLPDRSSISAFSPMSLEMLSRVENEWRIRRRINFIANDSRFKDKSNEELDKIIDSIRDKSYFQSAGTPLAHRDGIPDLVPDVNNRRVASDLPTIDTYLDRAIEALTDMPSIVLSINHDTMFLADTEIVQQVEKSEDGSSSFISFGVKRELAGSPIPSGPGTANALKLWDINWLTSSAWAYTAQHGLAEAFGAGGEKAIKLLAEGLGKRVKVGHMDFNFDGIHRLLLLSRVLDPGLDQDLSSMPEEDRAVIDTLIKEAEMTDYHEEARALLVIGLNNALSNKNISELQKGALQKMHTMLSDEHTGRDNAKKVTTPRIFQGGVEALTKGLLAMSDNNGVSLSEKEIKSVISSGLIQVSNANTMGNIIDQALGVTPALRSKLETLVMNWGKKAFGEHRNIAGTVLGGNHETALKSISSRLRTEIRTLAVSLVNRGSSEVWGNIPYEDQVNKAEKLLHEKYGERIKSVQVYLQRVSKETGLSMGDLLSGSIAVREIVKGKTGIDQDPMTISAKILQGIADSSGNALPDTGRADTTEMIALNNLNRVPLQLDREALAEIEQLTGIPIIKYLTNNWTYHQFMSWGADASSGRLYTQGSLTRFSTQGPSLQKPGEEHSMWKLAPNLDDSFQRMTKEEKARRVKILAIMSLELRVMGEYVPPDYSAIEKTEEDTSSFFNEWEDISQSENLAVGRRREAKARLTDEQKKRFLEKHNVDIDNIARFLAPSHTPKSDASPNQVYITHRQGTGPFAFRPLMAEWDSTDLPLFSLLKVKELVDARDKSLGWLSDYQNLKKQHEESGASGERSNSSFLPTEAQGHHYTSDSAQLPHINHTPMISPLMPQYIQSVSPVEVRARELEAKLEKFAVENGLTHLLDSGLYGELYAHMRIHENATNKRAYADIRRKLASGQISVADFESASSDIVGSIEDLLDLQLDFGKTLEEQENWVYDGLLDASAMGNNPTYMSAMMWLSPRVKQLAPLEWGIATKARMQIPGKEYSVVSEDLLRKTPTIAHHAEVAYMMMLIRNSTEFRRDLTKFLKSTGEFGTTIPADVDGFVDVSEIHPNRIPELVERFMTPDMVQKVLIESTDLLVSLAYASKKTLGSDSNPLITRAKDSDLAKTKLGMVLNSQHIRIPSTVVKGEYLLLDYRVLKQSLLALRNLPILRGLEASSITGLPLRKNAARSDILSRLKSKRMKSARFARIHDDVDSLSWLYNRSGEGSLRTFNTGESIVDAVSSDIVDLVYYTTQAEVDALTNLPPSERLTHQFSQNVLKSVFLLPLRRAYEQGSIIGSHTKIAGRINARLKTILGSSKNGVALLPIVGMYLRNHALHSLSDAGSPSMKTLKAALKVASERAGLSTDDVVLNTKINSLIELGKIMSELTVPEVNPHFYAAVRNIERLSKDDRALLEFGSIEDKAKITDAIAQTIINESRSQLDPDEVRSLVRAAITQAKEQLSRENKVLNFEEENPVETGGIKLLPTTTFILPMGLEADIDNMGSPGSGWKDSLTNTLYKRLVSSVLTKYPYLSNKLRIESSSVITNGRVKRDADGNYVIQIGKGVLDDSPEKAVWVLAHELSHLALEEGKTGANESAYIAFRGFLTTKQGRAYIAKLLAKVFPAYSQTKSRELVEQINAYAFNADEALVMIGSIHLLNRAFGTEILNAEESAKFSSVMDAGYKSMSRLLRRIQQNVLHQSSDMPIQHVQAVEKLFLAIHKEASYSGTLDPMDWENIPYVSDSFGITEKAYEDSLYKALRDSHGNLNDPSVSAAIALLRSSPSYKPSILRNESETAALYKYLLDRAQNNHQSTIIPENKAEASVLVAHIIHNLSRSRGARADAKGTTANILRNLFRINKDGSQLDHPKLDSFFNALKGGVRWGTEASNTFASELPLIATLAYLVHADAGITDSYFHLHNGKDGKSLTGLKYLTDLLHNFSVWSRSEVFNTHSPLSKAGRRILAASYILAVSPDGLSASKISSFSDTTQDLDKLTPDEIEKAKKHSERFRKLLGAMRDILVETGVIPKGALSKPGSIPMGIDPGILEDLTHRRQRANKQAGIVTNAKARESVLQNIQNDLSTLFREILNRELEAGGNARINPILMLTSNIPVVPMLSVSDSGIDLQTWKEIQSQLKLWQEVSKGVTRKQALLNLKQLHPTKASRVLFTEHMVASIAESMGESTRDAIDRLLTSSSVLPDYSALYLKKFKQWERTLSTGKSKLVDLFALRYGDTASLELDIFLATLKDTLSTNKDTRADATQPLAALDNILKTRVSREEGSHLYGNASHYSIHINNADEHILERGDPLSIVSADHLSRISKTVSVVDDEAITLTPEFLFSDTLEDKDDRFADINTALRNIRNIMIHDLVVLLDQTNRGLVQQAQSRRAVQALTGVRGVSVLGLLNSIERMIKDQEITIGEGLKPNLNVTEKLMLDSLTALKNKVKEIQHTSKRGLHDYSHIGPTVNALNKLQFAIWGSNQVLQGITIDSFIGASTTLFLGPGNSVDKFVDTATYFKDFVKFTLGHLWDIRHTMNAATLHGTSADYASLIWETQDSYIGLFSDIYSREVDNIHLRKLGSSLGFARSVAAQATTSLYLSTTFGAKVAKGQLGRKYLLRLVKDNSLTWFAENWPAPNETVDKRGINRLETSLHSISAMLKKFKKDNPKAHAPDIDMLMSLKNAGLLDKESIHILSKIASNTHIFSERRSYNPFDKMMKTVDSLIGLGDSTVERIFNDGYTERKITKAVVLDTIAKLSDYTDSYVSSYFPIARGLETVSKNTLLENLIFGYKSIYPLIGSQILLKNAARTTLPRYAAVVMAHLVGDIIYSLLTAMLSSRISPEELQKIYQNKDITKAAELFMNILARSPLFGVGGSAGLTILNSFRQAALGERQVSIGSALNPLGIVALDQVIAPLLKAISGDSSVLETAETLGKRFIPIYNDKIVQFLLQQFLNKAGSRRTSGKPRTTGSNRTLR